MTEQSPPREEWIEAPSSSDWTQLVDFLKGLAKQQPKKTEAAAPPGLGKPLSALHAVASFLARQRAFFGDDAVALKPIMELNSGLIDLLRGHVHPMFQPNRRAKGNGSYYEISKGLASRAMTLLMEDGVSELDAARKVARSFGGAVTATTVRNWRARLKEGQGARGTSAASLYAYNKDPSQLAPSLRLQAEALMREIKTLHGHKSPRKSHHP